jgi:hypothetical protein
MRVRVLLEAQKGSHENYTDTHYPAHDFSYNMKYLPGQGEIPSQPLPPVPPKKKDDTWILRLALLFVFICIVLAFAYR